MKLIRTYDMTSDNFYNLIEKQFVEDVFKSTGREVKVKDLKEGFRFTRINEKSPKAAPINVLINEYTRGKRYSLTARSAGQYTETSYTTEEVSPGKLQIVMEQDSSDMHSKSLRGFKRKFMEFGYYSAMSRALGNILMQVSQENSELPQPVAPLGQKTMKALSDKVNQKIEARKERKAEERENKGQKK